MVCQVYDFLYDFRVDGLLGIAVTDRDGVPLLKGYYVV
jgi:hypothetical protein